MKLLLHICCAPCSVMCIETLRSEGIEPVGFWFNPNIHPYTEYVRRRDTLKRYADIIGLETVFRDEYGLRKFIAATADDIGHRCGKCYEMRLDAAAEYAAGNGFPAFSSTLLISPYQNHELIKKIGEERAKHYGIDFLYRDFRPHFAKGQAKAREQKFYMQKYCGCIFSEESRYLNSDPVRVQLPDGCEFPNRRSVAVKRIKDGSEIARLFGSAGLSSDVYTRILDGADVFVLQVNGATASAAAVSVSDGKDPELLFLAAEDGFENKGYEENLLKQLCGNYGQKFHRMTVGIPAQKIPFFVNQGFDRYERTVKGRSSDCCDLHYYSKDLRSGREPF